MDEVTLFLITLQVQLQIQPKDRSLAFHGLLKMDNHFKTVGTAQSSHASI